MEGLITLDKNKLNLIMPQNSCKVKKKISAKKKKSYKEVCILKKAKQIRATIFKSSLERKK